MASLLILWRDSTAPFHSILVAPSGACCATDELNASVAAHKMDRKSSARECTRKVPSREAENKNGMPRVYVVVADSQRLNKNCLIS